MYRNYRLWALSSDTICCLLELGLLTFCRHWDNVADLKRFLDVIESTYFAGLPSSWRQRGKRAHNESPGHEGRSADLVNSNPWCRQILTEEAARQKEYTELLLARRVTHRVSTLNLPP